MTGWAATLAMLKAPRPGATLEVFRRSGAFVRGLMGPLSSGKTTTCALQVLEQAMAARTRSRWAIIRATLDQLTEQTMPAWHARVPADMGKWDGRTRRHVIPFTVGRDVVSELEIVFLAADQAADRRRIGTLELTGAWVDHARELAGREAIDDLVDSVGQWPPLLDLARSGAKAPRAGLLLSTRPPREHGHWWRPLFEIDAPAGYALFRQPAGRASEAENTVHLPGGFYARAASKPAEWVRTEVDADYPEPPAVAEDAARKRLGSFYPDEGPLRRALYAKHTAFFAAGAVHRERLALAANRVGKTEGMGGYETALHLTGLYPAWWVGKRFARPVEWWAAGKTNETTRDIVQAKLCGKIAWDGPRKIVDGTGLIPWEDIGAITWKRGSDLIDTIKVRHRNAEGVIDGWSILGIKSYEQGRGSFEGTEKHGIWYDEEPPLEIYTEGLIRTMTTGGVVLCTFTPLEGLSDVVMHYLPDGKVPDPATPIAIPEGVAA